MNPESEFHAIAPDDDKTCIRSEQAAAALRRCADELDGVDTEFVLARDVIYGQVNEAMARLAADNAVTDLEGLGT